MPAPPSLKTALARLLATCGLPVYALDARRRIAYYNPACARWLGATGTALLGQTCEYHSGTAQGDAADLATGLCPPPEVFQGQRLRAEVSCRDSAGNWRRRRAEFLPLPTERQDGFLVLALVESADLTDFPPTAEAAAAEPEALHQRLRTLINDLGQRLRLGQVIGESPAILRVREQVRLAIAGQARVVVVGPPGSGREHVARAIHYGSGSPNPAPLAPLNCYLLDTELLQSTVTSFIASCADLAIDQPPTLLLLEADQLAADAQAMLARTLGIGALNLRTLATARVPLAQLVADNRFRQDLACLLSTLVIELPPLAEHPQDIPLLAQWFLEAGNVAAEKQLTGFVPEATEQLRDYPWPRNADELAQVVRQACAAATGPRVPAAALPERIWLATAAAALPPREEESLVLDEFLAEIEKELLQRALARAKGNKTRAARLLGLPRARLLRRLEQLGLS